MRKALRLIALLSLLAGPAALPAQDVRSEWDMSVAEMQQMVERLREEMYRPGERVPGWNRGGANPDADLRAAGAERHYFQLQRPSGRGIIILSDRPVASFAPAGWRVADTYGSAAQTVDNPFVQFEALSPRYVVALRGGSARRGDADCVDSVANATLYERPDVAAGEADARVPLMFRLLLLAAENQTVCTRYQGNRAEGYRGLAFLPDGRSLPRLNESDERITIIPAGPIDRLVTWSGRGDAT
jgi:hypothetical protein